MFLAIFSPARFSLSIVMLEITGTYVWAKTNNGIYVLHGSNMKNTSIQDVDANGKTAGQIINNNSDAEVTIDLSKCDNGIFYVYIFENQKSKSIKLIKL